jgi:hypothetical protein
MATLLNLEVIDRRSITFCSEGEVSRKEKKGGQLSLRYDSVIFRQCKQETIFLREEFECFYGAQPLREGLEGERGWTNSNEMGMETL